VLSEWHREGEPLKSSHFLPKLFQHFASEQLESTQMQSAMALIVIDLYIFISYARFHRLLSERVWQFIVSINMKYMITPEM
jgi:hypothetical protein